jgi:hypothetical protein
MRVRIETGEVTGLAFGQQKAECKNNRLSTPRRSRDRS